MSINLWMDKIKWCVLSHVRLFVTPRTVAHQAPLSMRFSRQEYWSGLPLPTSGDLPGQETETVSLVSPALARFCHHCVTWEYVHIIEYYLTIKRQRNLTYAITWMNLKNIMLNERSESQETTYCIILLIWMSRIRKLIEKESRLVVA